MFAFCIFPYSDDFTAISSDVSLLKACSGESRIRAHLRLPRGWKQGSAGVGTLLPAACRCKALQPGGDGAAAAGLPGLAEGAPPRARLASAGIALS